MSDVNYSVVGLGAAALLAAWFGGFNDFRLVVFVLLVLVLVGGLRSAMKVFIFFSYYISKGVLRALLDQSERKRRCVGALVPSCVDPSCASF